MDDVDLAVIVDFDGLAVDELRSRYALPRRAAQKTPRLERAIVSSVVLWIFFLEINSSRTKRSICEEYQKANFLLKILTWENADKYMNGQSFSSLGTRISPLFVPLISILEKKGGRRGSVGVPILFRRAGEARPRKTAIV